MTQTMPEAAQLDNDSFMSTIPDTFWVATQVLYVEDQEDGKPRALVVIEGMQEAIDQLDYLSAVELRLVEDTLYTVFELKSQDDSLTENIAVEMTNRNEIEILGHGMYQFESIVFSGKTPSGDEGWSVLEIDTDELKPIGAYVLTTVLPSFPDTDEE